MALSRFLKDNNSLRSKAKVSVRSGTKKDSGPKNGPMIIGVAATILVMMALTFINIRLLSAPTPVNEPLSQSENTKKLTPVFPEMNSHKIDSKTCQAPTEVTFYRQLKTKEDKSSASQSSSIVDTKADINHTENKVQSGSVLTGAREDKNFSSPASAGQSNPTLSINENDFGATKDKTGNESTKGFIVQIGAFSHPRIAQEWASKWKAKGYKVTLKPVARPSSGIIYRLYLGDFESEKKADEFVKQLKAKEGITAMRLNARD